ncbi:putative transcriptional regulator, TetR family [Nocardia nova SH22a]|uniref:Putative transcriptional regulator, TetR family n=1 Tax=Nocardia nova SH22a TaxID=1415166 RepID=W5T8Q6_9NOCA|nr:TetR/AcrR family transcriptional regulator [Nocardia nova]AHH15597.1 putative transcriptional regulator, TetR family [Nocardia nova SH22a]
MARPSEPGRRALLDAGSVVAEGAGLRGLSINAVVATAGMSKGSFYHHFSDRRSYMIALHRRYHDALSEAVLGEVGDLVPGLSRITTAISAYLDACLRTRGTKAFLAQSRTDTDLLDEVHARNRAVAALVEPDLRAIGWDDPAAVAHLLVAMVAEIALAELYADAPQPNLRSAAIGLISR